MAATSEEIIRLLRQRKILASNSIQQLLQEHKDPIALLDLGPQIDFNRGVLSDEKFSLLNSLFENSSTISSPSVNNAVNSTKSAPTDLGRVIAPISTPEPLDIHFRNNLPDWKESDFSELANDAPNDILVHLSLIHI